MFDRLSKKLRALEYWQIAAVGVASLLASVALVLLGLAPLTLLLTAPLGQAVSGSFAFGVVVAAGFVIGKWLVPFFYWNLLIKKAEEAMVRIYAVYEDLRKTDSEDSRQDG